MLQRFLLFIDFKQAFDSVHLGLLIRKLLDKGVDVNIINTLIQLMNSSKISMDLASIVNVNSGTGQGKCYSPMLFDIYIDDLLDDLKEHSTAVYAFADDIGTLAEDLLHLHRIFDCIAKWSKEKHIEINYKKSGILIINDNGLNRSTIGGYPVVESYKYLGIDIDSKMKPNNHLRKLNTK
jgi:hypothetical protein